MTEKKPSLPENILELTLRLSKPAFTKVSSLVAI